MNKPFKPGEELISLNEELHTEFAIQELEQRLETDPLFVANLLNAAPEGGQNLPNCPELIGCMEFYPDIFN